jgi:hypothetical protein
MSAMTDRKFAEFFAVMSGIYGHKWVAQYGNEPDGISARVWNDGLDGLTLPQIANAVRYYKNTSVTAVWPPSLPEFRSVALGVPTLAKVKHDLRTGTATPFIKILWRFIDGYRWKQASYEAADRMAAEAYELAVACLTGGEPMPDELQAALSQDKEAQDRAEKEAYDRQHFNRLKDLEE